MVPVDQPEGESVMGVLGWIFAVILVALMLPLLAFLYLDNLTTNARTEKALDKLEKLEQKMERKNRDEPKEFRDNPLFDRRKKNERH
jgi:hypothetical protein